ncbi:type II toxin-antitoxin system RelB/DinJ family antitoxin [Schleiferilactobacillus harbinensis]|uniref:Uncharacterized protein n=1 Tax=Schleiferilactobacillus harbinensis DSM 16991 TaxID=1122147 RepID=A0A0R1XE56_9LACO|nr:type II toxin-antitoxin system RelB/DinJ family antitoxin [Schleiferilactobacillus harbinensis]KRM26233.1 hypothetical protein FC91_GL000180 [Schleiferilactobacillus harbinensis DSM 16991]
MDVKERDQDKNAKKRVQAMVDGDTVKAAHLVLDQLGVPTSMLINALYKRVVAEQRIPFTLALTPEEQVKDQAADLIDEIQKHVPTADKAQFGQWLMDNED